MHEELQRAVEYRVINSKDIFLFLDDILIVGRRTGIDWVKIVTEGVPKPDSDNLRQSNKI